MDDFESWREFSLLEKEHKSQDQHRNEPSHVDKINRNDPEKRKNDESVRIRLLLRRAHTLDPRIQKANAMNDYPHSSHRDVSAKQ